MEAAFEVRGWHSNTNILLRAPYPPKSTCSKKIIRSLLHHAVNVKEKFSEIQIDQNQPQRSRPLSTSAGFHARLSSADIRF